MAEEAIPGIQVKSVKTIQRNPALKPMVLIGGLFFVFGFVTWLGSVLIPYLKIACELNNFQSYLVAFSFYISYAVMAIPSSHVLKYTGYVKGISLGLLLMAVGSLLFIPAAMNRAYSIFLIGLFVQGTGLALLQTAANPYITILGPLESAAKRFCIMGFCNVTAGAIAPLILGAIVLSDADAFNAQLEYMTPSQKIVALNELAHEVIIPYVVITLILLFLAGIVYRSSLPEIKSEEDKSNNAMAFTRTSIFQFPHLLLGVLVLFVYVGLEVIAVNTIISYGESEGIRLATAKFFSSFTLVGMLVGLVIGYFTIPRFISQQKALQISAVLGLCFALVALATRSYISVAFIALLGLAHSVMWGAIWPLALTGLGKFTKLGSSLLIMAIGGGALIPLLYGYLADHSSPHNAYWLVIPCYCLIIYYAIGGYKIGNSDVTEKHSSERIKK